MRPPSISRVLSKGQTLLRGGAGYSDLWIVPYKKLKTCILDLDFGFQTFGTGSRGGSRYTEEVRKLEQSDLLLRRSHMVLERV